MSTLRTAVKSLKKTELVWRYVSNFGPTVSYVAGARERLTTTEKGLVEQLDEYGIAVTSIDALVDALQFDELDRSVAGLLENKTADITELKLNAANEGAIGIKTFNLEMLGSELEFDAGDICARFALNDSFLKIANSYFKMVSKLRYYNVWYTAASNSSARESQLWHFDREDNYILKIFLYLKDVDEGTGPLTYAPGTHRKGPHRNVQPEYFLEDHIRRTTDEQMAAVIPRENWLKATGKKGTIVFADTRGYHKGGDAKTDDRLMYTCMFTSPASQSKRLLTFSEDLDSSNLSKKQRLAL